MEKGLFGAFFAGVVLMVALWQLEMVFIGMGTGWGYRFFWLEPSTHYWFWRDVWYIIIFLSFMLLFFTLRSRR